MRDEENWETFTHTGQVSDYLMYAGERSRWEDRIDNTGKEERGRREGTCDGNGAFGSYHW